MHRTTDYLNRWFADDRISTAQHEALTAIVTRRRVSLYVELNVLLYLGVLAFVGGLGWTARAYSDRWGDAAILVSLTVLVAGCFRYAFAKAPAYSGARTEMPGLTLDYVLYLACLVVAVELSYIQYRFNLLPEQWDYYLLGSATFYLAVAYRFDNRFVLSLGLATLGSWFGVRLTRFAWFDDGAFRTSALLFGIVVAALGGVLHRARIKPHFVDAYMHVAATIVLAAVTWGVVESERPSLWFVAAVVASLASIRGGIHFRRFAFVVYGTFAAYVCVSRELLRYVNAAEGALVYVVASSALVILWLVALAKRLGREA
ncbi:MAG: hypothetical protein QM736_18270 [Vicinamibacterales bacterium]